MTGVATVWRGSVFNCTTNNTAEIILLDSGNSRLEDSVSTCNNGAILGKLLSLRTAAILHDSVSLSVLIYLIKALNVLLLTPQ